jgi:hypothetical protein
LFIAYWDFQLVIGDWLLEEGAFNDTMSERSDQLNNSTAR